MGRVEGTATSMERNDGAAAGVGLFAGPGEMRARCRALDWGATPFGPTERWPASLRTVADLVLAAPTPMIVLWGPELAQLYNDAYAAIMGAKHPAGLAQRNVECWPEVWEFTAPVYAGVRERGEAFTFTDQRLVLERRGHPETAYFTLTYSPVPDDDGAVGGVLVTVFETTAQVCARGAREAERERLLAESETARAQFAHQVRLFDGVADTTPDFVYLFDPEGRFQYANRRLLEVWGVSLADAVGRTCLELGYERWHHDMHMREIAQVVATKQPIRGEVPFRAVRTGISGVYEYIFTPVLGPDGEVELVAGTTRDVTARRQADAERERLLAESERARADLAAVNARLENQATELELATQQLQEQATELEAQTVELQLAVREMEEHAAAADRARRDAEAARAQTEAVLASIADPFYLLDRDWRFTHVNDAAEPLLQTTREALLGRTLWDAFPGVIGSVFEGPYREAMATGRVTSAEAYFDPLGTWFDVRTYPWAGGVMVHFRDVGARKAAEAERERLLRALEVERARLQEVFRRAPSFIVAFRGPTQVYEFVNDAYYQLVGHREIIGKPLLEAIPEIRGQGFDTLLDAVLTTGEPWVGREAPVELQRTPGAPLETRYLDMVFQALTEADGTRSGVVVHGSDITAQVLARREIEQLLGASERARGEAEAARGAAELANQAKGLFLANMSHELRTPLNAIGGYAQLLELELHGPVTAAQRGALARIQAAQTRLLALINDVLNYAKLESGHVEYDVRPVDVADVVRDVAPLLEPQLRAKGLVFEVEWPERPCEVWADREKLGQVLVNLLSNAVKFTDAPDPATGAPGRVTVSVATRADGPDGGRPELTFVRVTDTGRGVAREKQASIFEPFVQVRAGYAQATEGTGLGLAISRDLARGMGGDLRVRSREGAGSTFTVALRRVAEERRGA